MKKRKMMIIFEVPESQELKVDDVPILTHTRIMKYQPDILYHMPVKIIDCPPEIENILNEKEINWKVNND